MLEVEQLAQKVLQVGPGFQKAGREGEGEGEKEGEKEGGGRGYKQGSRK